MNKKEIVIAIGNFDLKRYGFPSPIVLFLLSMTYLRMHNAWSTSFLFSPIIRGREEIGYYILPFDPDEWEETLEKWKRALEKESELETNILFTLVPSSDCCEMSFF